MANVSCVEPRYARIAAVIGDPTRARMLGALLDGAALPAGEIAQAAGVNASTASAHLAKLVDEGLIAVQAQGRHRYYRVRDADVAHALEALSLIAERTAPDKWRREPYRSLKFARSCYRHLAGELGVRLHEALLGRGCVAACADGYRLTDAGCRWLEDIGMDGGMRAPSSGERYAFACLDWSERRHHLAGPLAISLLEHFLSRRWLVRRSDSRALKLTAAGATALRPIVGQALPRTTD